MWIPKAFAAALADARKDDADLPQEEDDVLL